MLNSAAKNGVRDGKKSTLWIVEQRDIDRLACSSVNSEAHPALSLPRHLTNVLAIQANFDFSFLTPEVILTNTFLILPHLLPTLINISGLNLSVIFLGLPVSGLGPHTSALIVLKILCHCL